MVRLSVVIVNYNVEYFLEQCLYSVVRATRYLQAEIFVVDNASVDGSVQMVKTKFPQVILMENKKNVGFSRANNQAIRQSTGDYVLLLNPDTLVEEDTLTKVVDFMDAHADAGGLGVKMIDGKGRFLPESKRGLPTPAVAFYKIFGLSSLFPKSKRFGRYHLGYLSNDQTHQVEILSGAFMLLRKATLDKTGLLDEDFFMYGEDIDLSWRIIQSGYRNYYYPHTRIIHYKGESTKKSSVNYVFVFYNAMVIFARKHFSAKHASTFSFFINLAIYIRASVAIFMRFVRKALVPAVDAMLIYLSLYLLRDWYENLTQIHYQYTLSNIAFGCYTLIWMAMVFLSGGYDKPVKPLSILRGVGIGTAVILFIYALLPESLRFSRALILLGTCSTLLVYFLVRAFLHFASIKGYRIGKAVHTKFAIIGSQEEYRRISQLLEETSIKVADLVWVEYGKADAINENQTERLLNIAEVYKIDEIIFCGKDLYSHQIIDIMSRIGSKQINFKIAPEESLYIIGSNSINKGGELFVMEINAVDKPANRRKKRLLDVVLSLLFLLFSPILVWGVRQKKQFFQNCLQVFSGRLSWVGFASCDTPMALPKIKSGVLSPVDALSRIKDPEETCRKLNAVYARNYSVRGDLDLIFSLFAKLGQNNRKTRNG